MLVDHFNGLNAAQLERLAILQEECGEVCQVIGKILRHGYESYNPNDPEKVTNRKKLEMEIGNILNAVEMLQGTRANGASDILPELVEWHRRKKAETIWPYLHHNHVEDFPYLVKKP